MTHLRKELSIILLFCLLFLSYCSKPNQTAYYLDCAESLVREFPDSTLVMLDSITDPEALNRKQYNRYLLLQIQAKDKACKDIISDTLIFEVRDYYLQKEDFENAALASFYCGRLSQYRKNYEKALSDYLDAEKQAGNANDYHLLGLIQSSIGSVFLQQLLMTQAIPHFKQAIAYFNEAKDKKNEIISYNLIGNAFLMNSERDSALLYYRKGFEVAEITNDSLQLANITQNIGVAYRESGDYDSTIRYFQDSEKYMTDSTNIARLYLNLSKIFNLTNQSDSAEYYIDKAFLLAGKEEDDNLLMNIYGTLSTIEKKKLNYEKSLEYYEEYASVLKKIVGGNKKEELLELRNQYQREQFRNENNKLKLKQQYGYSLFLSLFFIACLIAFFFYRKSILNKKRVLEHKNQILEVERKIYELEELSKTFDEKSNRLETMALHHFDTLKQFALEEHSKNQKIDPQLIRRFNKVIYKQEMFDPDIFYAIMNELHKGFFDRIKSDYPDLDEQEFRICYLTYIDLSSYETGTILNLSENTVNKKRYGIRKKLGIENNTKFSNFFNSLLNSSE